MIGEGHIHTQRKLRYFTTGNFSRGGKVVIALHGYSQHPKFFLRKFSSLAEEGDVFIAPEGPHRFYVQGHSGRVGASWMTKEDRLNDIADNHRYLEQVMKEVVPADAGKVILMGFSQGCATAVRFYCATDYAFDSLVLWAGSFPHDLSLPDHHERLNNANLEVVVGDEDVFIKASHIVALTSLLDGANIQYRIHTFPGGHDLHLPLLKKLI